MTKKNIKGASTDAPETTDGKATGTVETEPGAAYREAIGDTPTIIASAAPGATPAEAAPPASKPPRQARASTRKKRAYKKRDRVDTTKPAEPGKVPPQATRSAATAASPRQQAAGFAVALTVLHMGLAQRVPEMALAKGEAEQLGAALDNVCREFGYKPSAKAGAVLALAGTAFMVYGPKVAAVRARKRREAPAKGKPAPAGSNGATSPHATDEVDWEAVAAVERNRVAAGEGGTH